MEIDRASSKMEEGDTQLVHTSSDDDGDDLLVTARPKTVGFWPPKINIIDISNFSTFLIMIIGILLQTFHGRSLVSRFVLAFGLFGFAGGITNWLAVKMLFDRIPFLLGSGVIPRRFKEIRQAIKESVLEMFFDKSFLKHHLGPRSRELLKTLDLPGLLQKITSSPDFDTMFVEKLTELSQKPEGVMLATISQMFGGIEQMAPMLKPMLVAFGQEMAKVLVDKFDPDTVISVDRVRSELDIMMTDKLQQLTPERIKEIMEDVIRNHLGWLVVWGNFFGGLIGVVAVLAGYKG